MNKKTISHNPPDIKDNKALCRHNIRNAISGLIAVEQLQAKYNLDKLNKFRENTHKFFLELKTYSPDNSKQIDEITVIFDGSFNADGLLTENFQESFAQVVEKMVDFYEQLGGGQDLRNQLYPNSNH